MLCHYADKSCDHKHFVGRDMFLICHVSTLVSTRLKDYVNLWVEARQGESASYHV